MDSLGSVVGRLPIDDEHTDRYYPCSWQVTMTADECIPPLIKTAQLFSPTGGKIIHPTRFCPFAYASP